MEKKTVAMGVWTNNRGDMWDYELAIKECGFNPRY